jgi:hypothetical protein
MGVLEKIVYAGTMSHSFAQASQSLDKLAELSVSAKQVERLTERIGEERVVQRDEAVAAYEALSLTERKAAPQGVTGPAANEVAVVGCDGGRLQILDRRGGAIEAEDATEAASAEEGRRGQHWREDKIGLLMTMHSVAATSDPCPEIPRHFVDAARISKLTRELKTKTAPLEAASLTPAPEGDLSAPVPAKPETKSEATWEAPEVKQKRLIGSRVPWPAFGPILAQAAWQWGFFGAGRRVFLGDGSDKNWTIWRRYFSSFEPIVDFIHALSYVYAAAMAGRSFAEGWPVYEEWIRWLWRGQADLVTAALAIRQAELGEPGAEDGETHPRRVVERSLTYFQNQQQRMRYAEYRRQGLPITSSYVESAVKQFNQRVKGTEKFWKEAGAEAVLQLRADHLSDHAPLDGFWQTRQETQTGQRPYRMAA